jgi:hypothetical protein
LGIDLGLQQAATVLVTLTHHDEASSATRLDVTMSAATWRGVLADCAKLRDGRALEARPHPGRTLASLVEMPQVLPSRCSTLGHIHVK